MSRLSSMSPAALKAVFAPETDDNLIMLLTFYNPNGSIAFTIADGFTQRLDDSVTQDNIIYGVMGPPANRSAVVSASNPSLAYIFLPINVTLPSEEEVSAPRCSLTINDVSRALTPTIRNLTEPPKVLIDLVLSSTPTVVEASFPGFYMTSVTYNANTIQTELSMISYQNEPFPSFKFVPRYFPGLF
jgi:hypothetical protein